MTKTNYEKPFHVAIIESERDEQGCSQRTDEICGYDSREEADAFIIDFNKENNKPVTPDWYMYAKALYP